LLEIGSVAYGDLTSAEVAALCAKYSSTSIKLAGMHSFELLWKKFQPTYRMGKTYEALSDKYENYRKIYVHYTQSVGAGVITGTTAQMDEYKNLDRYKFAAEAEDETTNPLVTD